MQQISPNALRVLRTLEERGYCAFLVGGCVRDLLLNRPVNDWDITTSALPQQTQESFEKSIPTGIQHGTITVLLEGESFEVTTFRADGAYLDGRRPAEVAFVPNLQEDLARRDFTINAMAMDARGEITDLYGGREDLQRGLIRCVGEAETRFSEDALRMLRAVRFSAQLDFSIEEGTQRAILTCAKLCEKLSAERVRDEIEKTILSRNPAHLARMIEWGLLTAFGLRGEYELSALGNVPAERLTRWAQAKHMLPQLDLSMLRLEKRAVRLCTAAAELCTVMQTELDCKRIIASHGWETAQLTAQLCGMEQVISRIEGSGDCVSLAQLAIRGGDLPELQGAAVADALHRVLEHVLQHPDENEREHLLDLLHRGEI
ncbi:MAG: CCA tRNA nucleotidyltransferase [Ruminococcaceae bacterium]|nr:CCA tRNA nucleotidyltransferase [Oscillospiraceae bacterium]